MHGVHIQRLESRDPDTRENHASNLNGLAIGHVEVLPAHHLVICPGVYLPM